MNKARLEAFSDGVFAIIITIMVLEIKVPHGEDWESLKPLIPIMMSYVLSFLFVGIYWVNHHHLIHTITKVNGAILWSNIHLLFWLSLVPVATDWMGDTHLPRILLRFMRCFCCFAALRLQYFSFLLKRKMKAMKN